MLTVAVPPTEEMKRLLRVIGKIIQNVANLIHFKEENMQVFNCVVDENREKMLHFYSELSALDLEQESHPTTATAEDKIKDMSLILKHLACNLPRILKEIPNDARCVGREEKIREEMVW